MMWKEEKNLIFSPVITGLFTYNDQQQKVSINCFEF